MMFNESLMLNSAYSGASLTKWMPLHAGDGDEAEGLVDLSFTETKHQRSALEESFQIELETTVGYW